MRIRKYRNSDAAELAKLHRETIRSFNSRDYSKKQIKEWTTNITAKWFRDSVKNTVRLVALDRNKLMGFVGLKHDDLLGLYIHKNYVNQGTGLKLLKKIEFIAAKKSIKILNCLSTITAYRFYLKNGYKKIKKTICKIGNLKLPVYKMEKQLKTK